MATYNNIKKIKIGDNIFNLYDSGNSGGTVTGVKINGSTKSPSSGIVDLGSGFLTSYTDEKLAIAKITNYGTTNIYNLIMGQGYSSATRQYDDLTYYAIDGTTSTAGYCYLRIGNELSKTSAGNKTGILTFYSDLGKRHDLRSAATAQREIYLPDSSGTIALTSDLSNYVSKTTTTDQSIASSLLMPEGKILYLSTTSSTKPRLYADASTTYHDCIYYKTGNNSDTSNHYHAFYAAETGIFYITPSSVYTANSATFTSGP